jgi:UDP-N-acetylmuramate--alanine ligase
LFDDFVKVLAKADRAILVPIYAARKEEGYTKTSEDIVASLRNEGIAAEHFMTQEAAALAIKESVTGDDAVLVMGAGDVSRVATLLTKQ